MDKNINIQDEINKTLTSLDNIERRKAKPFLYTRIQAKLDTNYKTESYNWFFDTPILKPALAVLFIAINIFTIWQISIPENTLLSNKEVIINSFTEEYAFNQSTETIFDFENE